MNTLYSNLIFTLTNQLTVDHHLLQGGKLYQKNYTNVNRRRYQPYKVIHYRHSLKSWFCVFYLNRG